MHNFFAYDITKVQTRTRNLSRARVTMCELKMIKLVSANILIYHLSIFHTHSYRKKSNTKNRYLQHIVQKYLQFINISATIKTPFEGMLTVSQFVYVKFLWLGFTLSWRRPLTPWKLALGLTTRAWLPPNSLSVACSVWRSPPLVHSNHSKHLECFPSRRVAKAVRDKRNKQEKSVLVWHVTCPSFL